MEFWRNRKQKFVRSIFQLRARVSSRDGQTTVEYILILTLAVSGASLTVRKILQGLDYGALKLGGQMERDLKTGRSSIRVYKN